MLRDGDVRRLLQWVAVAGLESDLDPPPPLSADNVTAMLNSAYPTSLDGHIFASVQDGHLVVPPELVQTLARQHTRVMVRALHIERQLLAYVGELERRGIEYRLLKGVALAHSIYADPAYRSYADADILVRPDQFDRGIETALEMGGVRKMPEVGRGFDRRFAKDVPVNMGGVEIDLHRTLLSGPYGFTIRPNEFFDRASLVKIGGRQLSALDLADLCLHAAVTAGAADVPPRIVTLSDIGRITQQCTLDPDEVIRRAEGWKIRVPTARGLRCAQQELRLPGNSPLFQWSARIVESRSEAWIQQQYAGNGRSYRRTLATLAVLPGWRERTLFARYIVAPSKEYRTARGWTRRDHVLRALRSLRRDQRP